MPHGLQRELRGDARVEDLREVGRRRERGRPGAPRRLSRLLPKDLDAWVPADAPDVLRLWRVGHGDAAGESVALRGIEGGVGAGGRSVGEGRGGRGVLSAPGAVGEGDWALPALGRLVGAGGGGGGEGAALVPASVFVVHSLEALGHDLPRRVLAQGRQLHHLAVATLPRGVRKALAVTVVVRHEVGNRHPSRGRSGWRVASGRSGGFGAGDERGGVRSPNLAGGGGGGALHRRCASQG